MRELQLKALYAHLLLSGLSKSTARDYIQRLNTINKRTNLELTAIRAYFADQIEKNASRNTLNVYVKAIRKFGEWSGDEQLTQLPYFKKKQSRKEIMRDDEIEAFLGLPPLPHQHQQLYLEHTVFFATCAYTGMRMGEVSRLKTSDLGPSVTYIRVYATKTDTYRTVPILPPLRALYDVYLRKVHGDLFPHVKSYTWSSRFRERCKRLGIERPGLTCYSLRHSFVTSLIGADVALPKVMKLVGHQNINTTMEYIHLVYKDVESSIQRLGINQKHLSPREKLLVVLEAVKATGMVDELSIRCSGTSVSFDIQPTACSQSADNTP